MHQQQQWDPEAYTSARTRRLRLAAVLGGLVAVAVVVWLVTRGGDDSSSHESLAPEAVTPAALSQFAGSRSTPVYWAGEQAGATLELSEYEDGRVYVRYLTGGAKPGSSSSEFLTVGTYEFAEPVAALEKLSNQAGGVRRTIPGGGIAYFNRNSPQNVYVAYPGVEAQIEVYDPDPGRATELATSGQIVPIS